MQSLRESENVSSSRCLAISRHSSKLSEPAPVEVSGYKANIQEQDDILLYIKKVTFNNIIKSLLAAMGFVGPCVL